MTDTTQNAEREREPIPYNDEIIRIGRGTSPAAKFILAVAAMELVRDEAETPHDGPERNNIVVIPAKSTPMRDLRKLFGRGCDESFLRELASIPLEYASYECFVMKPVFTRVECRKVGMFGQRLPEIVLHIEPAFAEWARSESFFRVFDEALDWPVGLLEDLYDNVWKEESLTRIRPAYLVVDRPRVCPFCGRESIVRVKYGFSCDESLFNACSHDLLDMGGCCVDGDDDPQWCCAGCGLGFMQAAPEGHCVDRRSIREYLAGKA